MPLFCLKKHAKIAFSDVFSYPLRASQRFGIVVYRPHLERFWWQIANLETEKAVIMANCRILLYNTNVS